MSQREAGRGFLLKFADLLTKHWVNSLSIAAIPLFRRQKAEDIGAQQMARDIYVSLWLILAISAVVCVASMEPTSLLVLQVLATIGLYRGIDVFLSFSCVGIFLCFRGDIPLNEEPVWRIQRILLAVFINYFELILWFALIYFFAASTAPSQFGENAPTMVHQAVNLSFSTMTTVGYGVYAPNSAWTNALTMFQTATGILLAVIVFGSLVSLLTTSGDTEESTASQPSPPSTWHTPVAASIGLGLIIYLALGHAFPGNSS